MELKSHEEILEQSKFMKEYNEDNNPGSLDSTFYEFHCTQIDFNGQISHFENDKVVKTSKSNTSSTKGSITFEMDRELDEYFSDENGYLQTSALGVWVDIVTSLVVSGFDPEGRMVHVSANLSLDVI